VSIITETESYKKLQFDIEQTKKLLFSERDKVIDFEVEYPDKTKRTLHFKRLRASEWDHVIGVVNALGDLTKATQEQLDGMKNAMCLALGYASADGLNAEDWKNLDDKVLIETCYFKLMDISGVSKDAIESLSWFREQWRRKDDVDDAGKNG
jgi:hypothetical protein